MRQQIVWIGTRTCGERIVLQNLVFFFFFFFGDIIWLFPAVLLQQIGVGSDTKTDTGQPKQN